MGTCEGRSWYCIWKSHKRLTGSSGLYTPEGAEKDFGERNSNKLSPSYCTCGCTKSPRLQYANVVSSAWQIISVVNVAIYQLNVLVKIELAVSKLLFNKKDQWYQCKPIWIKWPPHFDPGTLWQRFSWRHLRKTLLHVGSTCQAINYFFALNISDRILSYHRNLFTKYVL